MGWKFYIDSKPWLGGCDLHILNRLSHRRGHIVLPPIQMVEEKLMATNSEPFLSETKEAVDDGCGDVTGFLQAALDAAWEFGLRPTGFQDHTNELSAVRYHLEDMRKLGLAPHVSVTKAPE